MNNQNTIFIPGNVPSLKNSKVKTARGIFPSKTVTRYLRNFGIQGYSGREKKVFGYKTIPDTFRPYAEQMKIMLAGTGVPYKLGFYFVRRTKSRFDFGNAVELIADMLTAYDVWEDDNCDYFLPFPNLINGVVYHVDKTSPGVYITILK